MAAGDDDNGGDARTPIRAGAGSADLVLSEDFGPGELKALLVFVPAAGAVVAGLAGLFLTILMAALSHPRWPAILTIMGLIFGGIVLWSVKTTLTGVRRIEFQPAQAPTRVRLVRPLGTEVIPIDRLAGIILRHPVEQSPDYPWTLSPAGTVDIRLDIVGDGPDDGHPKAVTIEADADVLARHLGDLLAQADVYIDSKAEKPPGYDPDIVDDRLPPDGIVLQIIRRRPRPGVRDQPWRGYLSDQEVGAAWDPVWHVPHTAAANNVRLKHRSGGYPSNASWVEYRAVDVQRVADEIAAGTAVTEPGWRTDTEVGRDARAAHAASRAGRRSR